MKFNITITEALAEIKTIGKRLETKMTQLTEYLCRDSKLRDPMEKEGGSPEYIKRERQAMKDLQVRIIDLRTAIMKANMETKLKLDDREMTVFEWLIWRREVAPKVQASLSLIWQRMQQARKQAQIQGFNVVAAASAAVHSGDTPAKEIIVNINEMELATERENVEKTLGELDGRLSLLNATTTI